MTSLRIPRLGWMLFVGILVVASLVVIFRLGNQASAGVSLNDPVVWIEDGARGRVLQINGSTREITAAVRVGDAGDSLVAIPRGRDTVFLNRTTGELGVIGAVSLAVDSIEPLPGVGGPLQGDHLELKADLKVSTDAFILDTVRTLVFEPGAGERLDIPTPDGLGDTVIDAEGRLVAVTVDAERIGVTTDRGLVPLVSLPAPLASDSQPPALVRAGNTVYVVDAARRTVNEVIGTDELGPTTCVAGSLSDVRVGGNVLTSSVGTNRVLVHDSVAGVLSVTEPDESDCFQIEIEETGDNWGDPVAVDEIAYLPNFETGRIVIVDLRDRVVLDSVRFSVNPGVEFELEVFDGAVWANEPQGARAAIISRDDILQISKLRAIRISEDPDENGDGLGGIVGGEGSPDRVFGGDGDVPAIGGPSDPLIGPGRDQSVPGGEDLTDAELEDGEVPADLPDSPLLVDVIEGPVDTPDELVANFVFSASTVNVGEPVSFVDESTGNPNSWNWDFGDGTGADGPDVTKTWDSEGVFTVTLFVANAAGAQAQQSLDITVVAVDVLRVPTADFSFRSGTVEVGESIEFVDESTGEPDSLLWSFGDGTTGSGPLVTHVFAEAGSFEVSLTASNEAGPNTTSAVITVVEGVKAPEAIIGRFPGVVEVGQTVTLISESTNTPTAVSWGFGDGDSALGRLVRHAWVSPGTYRIRLSVSNSAAADETFADIVVEPRVNPPSARFGQSALQVVVGETISFNDLSLNNPTTLTWEFGDGSSVQGKNVTHTWDQPGSYTVTLTAQNEAGSDDVSKTVTIIPLPPNPPKAAFTIASATVPVNSVVRFNDTSTGDPTEWQWEFGDGTSSVAKSPPHGYSSPGTYVVTLTASNAGGSSSASKTIIVVDPPTASYTRTISELVVTFSDTSTNGPTEWSWDFGDGTLATAQNPVKTYAAAGTYSVTLIAKNSAGTSAPFTATVRVAKLPKAAFTVVTGGLTAQFTDTSTNAPASWSWDFGDGNTSTVQSPTHTYATGGTYPVALTVANTAGTNTTTSSVTVMLAPPNAAFTCQVIGGGVACDGSTSTGAASFSWSGPGAVSSSGTTTPNASFTYATSGNYDITLTVQNGAGTPDSDTQTVTVTVPQPPGTPVITVNSNNNGVVSLSATATNSPTSWNWSTTGGGTISGGSTSSPTITYGTSGSKTVTVTASNGVGTSGPAQQTFNVTVGSPPVVSSVNVVSSSGGSVQVNATASNSPTSWAWTMSNGGSPAASTLASPTFTFTTNGVKNGTVIATNGTGSSASFPFQITVSGIVSPPVIQSINQSEGPAGLITVSTNTTGGAPTSWTWSVPTASPTSSNSANPSFQFTANGSYPGTVTVSNAGGSDTFNFNLNVTGVVAPNANFTVTNPPGLGISVVGVSQANATYVWDFGDGNGATGLNASNTYVAGGTYTVTLTVTRFGIVNSSNQPVTVVP